MMKRLPFVVMLGLAASLVACGGAMDEGAQEQEVVSAQPGEDDANVSVEQAPGTVSASAYGCCAWCWNRARYHLVEGVVSNCTQRASDYCAVGDRGGLFDAAWTDCAP